MFVGKLCLVLLSFVLGLASAELGEDSLSYRNKCPRFQIRKSTIIKTQQSIHDGAEFLGKKVMTSSRGCHNQCCKAEGCNLVMLKYDVESSEEKVSCFMFNCRSPSVCTFYQHSSYHSYAALEYEDRKSQYYGKTKDYKTEYHKVETTTEPPNPTTTKKAYKANRKWGNINWFEATTTSKPKYVRPKYNKDGYDKTNSWGKKNWLDDQDLDKFSTTHQSYNHKTDNTRKANPWHIDEPKKPKSYDSSKVHIDEPKKTKSYESSKYGTYDHTQNADTFKIPTKQTTAADEEEDFPRRVFVDNNPDFPDEPHSHHSESPPEKQKETKPPTTKSPHVKTTRGTTTKSPPANHFVIRRLNIQDNKAVIPLAIGLVLALLLLLGVIFRLKTSRRRRTKAFLTDDADYLINGMYL